MSLASLVEVLRPAVTEGYAVMGAVVLGWEDAETYVEAAEETGSAIILQAGPNFRQSVPVNVSGTMFRTLGEVAAVPVVAHIDHAKSIEECRTGIEAGFTSVMYDGSALPLEENIAATAEVVSLAHRHGVSVEAEIGFVGYAEGASSKYTDPQEAAKLATETGVDALAVSVGNTHLQQSDLAEIKLERLAEIETVTDCPLVLHGASGIPSAMRRHLALKTRVCKFNVGTEFRYAFGQTLRRVLAEDTSVFDRREIFKKTMPTLKTLAIEVMSSISP